MNVWSEVAPPLTKCNAVKIIGILVTTTVLSYTRSPVSYLGTLTHWIIFVFFYSILYYHEREDFSFPLSFMGLWTSVFVTCSMSNKCCWITASLLLTSCVASWHAWKTFDMNENKEKDRISNIRHTRSAGELAKPSTKCWDEDKATKVAFES